MEAETDLNNLNGFVDLFNDIPRFQDCNYDDAVDWVAIYVNDLECQILDGGEIITSLQNQSGNEESNNSSSYENMRPSFDEAFAAFKANLEWFEKQAKCYQVKMDNFVKKYHKHMFLCTL